jgi:hypothetical protein
MLRKNKYIIVIIFITSTIFSCKSDEIKINELINFNDWNDSIYSAIEQSKLLNYLDIDSIYFNSLQKYVSYKEVIYNELDYMIKNRFNHLKYDFDSIEIKIGINDTILLIENYHSNDYYDDYTKLPVLKFQDIIIYYNYKPDYFFMYYDWDSNKYCRDYPYDEPPYGTMASIRDIFNLWNFIDILKITGCEYWMFKCGLTIGTKITLNANTTLNYNVKLIVECCIREPQ